MRETMDDLEALTIGLGAIRQAAGNREPDLPAAALRRITAFFNLMLKTLFLALARTIPNMAGPNEVYYFN